MVLPKELRQAMGLSGDTRVIATIEDGEVRLTPVHHHARKAQALYRQHVPEPRSVDDFLEDRKRDAEREESMVEGDDDHETGTGS
jgi:bifunctional DNA-binding transcriptional regulator/antitoxin component of YhaV-PrlF toxin-antitoxin module